MVKIGSMELVSLVHTLVTEGIEYARQEPVSY